MSIPVNFYSMKHCVVVIPQQKCILGEEEGSVRGGSNIFGKGEGVFSENGLDKKVHSKYGLPYHIL